MQIKEKIPHISFFAKKEIMCPLCKESFHHESLHSGGGRLISSHITSELRRTYKPNPKFGRIWPQVYTIQTCPKCFYSSFPLDFEELEAEEIKLLNNFREKRKKNVQNVLGSLTFRENRNVVLGAASYLLAFECYQKRGVNIAPTPKKALCSLRAAWLIGDIAEYFPRKGFEKLVQFLYMKAMQNYTLTLDIMGSRGEPHTKFLNILGPDTDKNWGFEGVIYINSYLTHQYAKLCFDSNEDKIVEQYRVARCNLSRLYGHGKVSSSKPSLIVEYARTLYDTITFDLEKMGDVEMT